MESNDLQVFHVLFSFVCRDNDIGVMVYFSQQAYIVCLAILTYIVDRLYSTQFSNLYTTSTNSHNVTESLRGYLYVSGDIWGTCTMIVTDL